MAKEHPRDRGRSFHNNLNSSIVRVYLSLNKNPVTCVTEEHLRDRRRSSHNHLNSGIARVYLVKAHTETLTKQASQKN